MMVEPRTYLSIAESHYESNHAVPLAEQEFFYRFSSRPMVSLVPDSWPLKQCQKWVPSRGVGLEPKR